MNIIANIVYYHSQDFPNINKGNLKNLEIYDKIVIAKLLAILRISDSLDKSHKQNFKNFKLDYKNSELNITVKTNENTSIDEWNFNKRKEFTMEVFGIKINLRKKKLFKLD
jgi:exopolyphosphatase/guanosine-5'-triphosphate,3'-diphosphate pyrophosphatase